MNMLPPSRTKNIVMQDLGKEILLYDLINNKAFSLNETTTIVYRHCDGITTFADLQTKFKDLSDEIIFLALDLLNKENLLESDHYISPFNNFSRRQAVRKIGLVTIITLPAVFSLVAPTPAMASSTPANCIGKLAPNADTGYHCNFGSFSGTAAFCDQIQCSESEVETLCCSGSATARLDTAPGPNFYRCYCT